MQLASLSNVKRVVIALSDSSSRAPDSMGSAGPWVSQVRAVVRTFSTSTVMSTMFELASLILPREIAFAG